MWGASELYLAYYQVRANVNIIGFNVVVTW